LEKSKAPDALLPERNFPSRASPYRIVIVEEAGRRSLRKGIIEAEPSVISALAELGEGSIEVGGLGWFGFYVTDVHRGEITLTGWKSGLDSLW
jgi:hypothetical protein